MSGANSLPFASSERSSVGIEWELQLIDRDSRDLRQAANAVLDALGEPEPGEPRTIHAELLVNTVEIVSQPRRTVREAGDDLLAAVDRIRTVTDPLRIDLASAGTHPFARSEHQHVTDKERYAELVRRTQYWGRQMLVYGVHVHVGIEDRTKVLPILRALLTRIGHMQSLSASSPFWQGVDTSYASNRAMYFQQLPTAGVPHQFSRWEDLEGYVADMKHTGVIDEFNEVRWDVRPSPALGTIEIRAFDATTNIKELLGLAALTHCLVEHYSTMLDRGHLLPTLPDWFVNENKWRSSRYGMDAILILDDKGEEDYVAHSSRQMLAELEPVAERLGCTTELGYVHTILDRGAAYQRMTTAWRENERDVTAMVDLMVREMEAGRPLDPHPLPPL